MAGCMGAPDSGYDVRRTDPEGSHRREKIRDQLCASCLITVYVGGAKSRHFVLDRYSFSHIHVCEPAAGLLTGVQIGVALSLVLAGVWYAFVLHNLSAAQLTFLGLPASTHKEFADDIQKLEGNEIRPKNIRVKKGFYGIVRNYQLRLLLGSLLVDSSILLLLLAAIHGVILLVDPQYARSIGSYHAVIAYGILVAAAGLASSFYVFSVLLQNFRKVSAALIAAVLSAGLPFLLDYLLGGQFDTSGLRAAIFAGSGGLTAALVTVITSNVKSSME